jgi:hypothetical protein
MAFQGVAESVFLQQRAHGGVVALDALSIASEGGWPPYGLALRDRRDNRRPIPPSRLERGNGRIRRDCAAACEVALPIGGRFMADA